MKFLAFLILVICILDIFWGGGYLLKEIAPYYESFRIYYQIFTLILAIVLASFLAGSVINYFEENIIPQLRKKEEEEKKLKEQEEQKNLEKENNADTESSELGEAENTIKS